MPNASFIISKSLFAAIFINLSTTVSHAICENINFIIFAYASIHVTISPNVNSMTSNFYKCPPISVHTNTHFSFCTFNMYGWHSTAQTAKVKMGNCRLSNECGCESKRQMYSHCGLSDTSVLFLLMLAQSGKCTQQQRADMSRKSSAVFFPVVVVVVSIHFCYSQDSCINGHTNHS